MVENHGHECVAHVSGYSLSEVIDNCTTPAPLSMYDMDFLLGKLLVKATRHVYPTIETDKLYIATVPSLNYARRLHYIVIDTREGRRPTVYDPNKGAAGKKVYNQHAIPTHAIASLVEIEP